MIRLLRRAVKASLKGAYHLLGWALPSSIRNEIEGYRRYRWLARQPVPPAAPSPALVTFPAWERREKPGQTRAPVRLGFVGAGTYAQHHLKALANLDRVEIVSLLTTGGPRAREAMARYNIPNCHTDIDEFLGQPDLDGLVVVVPTQHLYPVALKCLAAGKPVLLEKPPGVTSGETAALAQQAERSHTFGMVAMNRRFYSVLEHGLARLAECGPIRGAMLEVPHQITQDRQARRLANFDYDHFYVRNSIHGVDLLRYILGDPDQVHSLAWLNAPYQNSAASIAALLEYSHGIVASVTDLWDTPQVWRLKVVAESGWLELESLESGWFMNAQRQKTAIPSDPVDSEFRPGIYAQALCFVEAIRQGRKPARPACLLPDAVKTMALMESILSSNLSAPRQLPAEPQKLHWVRQAAG